MSQDITGKGLAVTIIAIPSFPVGFEVNQFADDADPLDMADIQIADTAMGLNGDLIVWNTANPIPMILNVIPGSEDDTNLSLLAELNRVARGKISTKDKIGAVISYPDGKLVTLIDGRLTNAPASDSVTSAGRKKTKAYTFAFENKVEVLKV
jgi:hypothetical protein